MKNLAILVFAAIIAIPLSSFAGNDPDNVKPKNEFSFALNQLSDPNIAFNYAYRISENNWLNCGLRVNGSITIRKPLTNTTYPRTEVAFNPYFNIGFEHHKPIKENLEFVIGADFIMYSWMRFTRDKNPSLTTEEQSFFFKSFQPGVDINLGIYYKFSECFAIGSSLNPTFYFDRYKVNNSEFQVSTFAFHPLLSIIDLRYRF